MKKRAYCIDLIRQMAECDANYIRLLKLIPSLRELRNKSLFNRFFFSSNPLTTQGTGDPGMISARNTEPNDKPSSQQDSPGRIAEFSVTDIGDGASKTVVEINVVESFKYTTTLEIIQHPEIDKWVPAPTMQVRVYHDASTAEVVSYQNHRNFKPRYSQPNPKMYQSDEKTRVNEFLGEWLTHCLKAGRCLKVPDIAVSE